MMSVFVAFLGLSEVVPICYQATSLLRDGSRQVDDSFFPRLRHNIVPLFKFNIIWHWFVHFVYFVMWIQTDLMMLHHFLVHGSQCAQYSECY